MMDGPGFPAPVPRLKDPRLSVPAGAVAVAGRQAVIAPATAPGGWCVIGQTPLTVLNIRQRTAGPLHARRHAALSAHRGRRLSPYAGRNWSQCDERDS